MIKYTNESAFPGLSPKLKVPNPGMNMRQWYAGKALQGWHWSDVDVHRITRGREGKFCNDSPNVFCDGRCHDRRKRKRIMVDDPKVEFEVRVGKLRLKKGDILIVKCDRQITREAMSALGSFVASKLPAGVEYIMTDPTLEFDIITFDQIQERKKTA